MVSFILIAIAVFTARKPNKTLMNGMRRICYWLRAVVRFPQLLGLCQGRPGRLRLLYGQPADTHDHRDHRHNTRAHSTQTGRT